MNDALRWIDEALDLTSGTAERVLAILIVIGLYVLIVQAVRLGMRWRTRDPGRRLVVTRGIAFLGLLVLAVTIPRIWFGRFIGVIQYLGIVSAGIAIALQKPLTSLAGMLYILWRKPFSLGDRVQIGDHAGDVIDVRLFTFTVMEIREWVNADQTTGRVLHIPNSWVFEHVTCNYVQEFDYIWNEMSFTLSGESNWRKAKSILERIVEQHSPIDGDSVEQNVALGPTWYTFRQDQLHPSVWTSLVPDGTHMSLRFLTGARNRRAVTTAIAEAILDAFAEEPDIEMAYPTVRVFNNTLEGKPPLRPEGFRGTELH